jgi:hypothetical protein
MSTNSMNRLAILVVVRRFPGMGAAGSRSLRSDSYVRMQHFVRRSTYVPFRRFWGDVRREVMQRFLFFCCSSWHYGFLTPRRFSGGQC